jgi:hypothetical protein
MIALTTSIIYSARDLRDGHLTASDVQVIATLIHPKRWQPGGRAGGHGADGHAWVDIHDYLDTNRRATGHDGAPAAAGRMRRVRAKFARLRTKFSRVRKKLGDCTRSRSRS